MNDAFARWLADATRPLVLEHQERFRSELTEHYLDTVAAYRDRGYTAAAAERAALDDLGDPAHTARAFAKVDRRPWFAARFHIERAFGSTDGRVLVILVVYIALTGAVLSQTGVDAMLIAMQTASLALLVSTQLFFDDLDLSLGVVALMGTLVAQVPMSAITVLPLTTTAAEPWAMYAALVAAMVLGGIVGTLNGVVVVTSRRPAAYITLGTALGLALLLYPFRALHRSIWSVAPHWTAAILGARPVLYLNLRTLISVVTVAIFAVALCSMVVASHATRDEVVEDAWNEPRVQRWQGRTLILLGAALFPFMVFLGTLNRGTADNPFVLVLAVVVSLALVVVIDELAHTSARRWFTAPAAMMHGRQISLARVARFALCGVLAALVGALITAYGMRDNTYRFAAAFLNLVPLSVVLVGGQHTLRRPYRLLGGIAGSLVVAALTSWADDYKLNDDAMFGVLLAAVGVVMWRWAYHPQGLARKEGTPVQGIDTRVDLDIA